MNLNLFIQDVQTRMENLEYFVLSKDFKDFYETVSHYMKSPVIKEFYCDSLPKFADKPQLKFSRNLGVELLLKACQIIMDIQLIQYLTRSTIKIKSNSPHINIESDVQKKSDSSDVL